MTTSATLEVDTDQGPGRLHLAIPDAVRGAIVLGGGASGQVATVDLTALADHLPDQGWVVARYELPWRVAGRSVGPRPPGSDPLWQAGVEVVRERWPGVPMVTGGRSASARIAVGPGRHEAGIVALSFPLRTGQTNPNPLAELQPVGVPVLLVSGDRDPYGSPDELTNAVSAPQAGQRQLVIIPGATHSFPVRTVPAVLAAVAGFLTLALQSNADELADPSR